jgi:hypothetical protein
MCLNFVDNLPFFILTGAVGDSSSGQLPFPLLRAPLSLRCFALLRTKPCASGSLCAFRMEDWLIHIRGKQVQHHYDFFPDAPDRYIANLCNFYY